MITLTGIGVALLVVALAALAVMAAHAGKDHDHHTPRSPN